MMLRTLVILILLYAFNASADAKYDSEDNIVELNTPLLSKKIDPGSIKIHSENHIKLFVAAYDDNDKKGIGLCGKDPSLGLLILDGELKIGEKVPTVTDVENWPATTDENKLEIKAGWVVRYIFKGDDARDLMDLLSEYQSVGFAFTGKGCTETKYTKPGKIILNFKTKGLERAMKRIK
jgi:hypothetical protein